MSYDYLIAGGGLSGGLLAYRLKEARPDWKGLLLERGDWLGGDHTWSFHLSDLSKSAQNWITPLVSARWEEHEVRFPHHKRTLKSPYCTIRSRDFHKRVSHRLGESILLRAEVSHVDQNIVRLATGEVFRGERVIDARGFQDWDNTSVGYQKFIGWDVTLESPHGLKGPILMDATVPQDDGYRFFYVLPFEDRRLLIEDTHYSDSADLGRDQYREEIAKYAAGQGWKITDWNQEEIGILPIPLQRRWSEIALGKDGQSIGVRAGLFQPTTGYSLPYAVRLIEELVGREKWTGDWILEHVRACERQGRFFRFLNRMLFLGCAPEERYRILERFYRLPDGVVARFYSGELRAWDCFRLLVGRPPISLRRAWDCYPDLSEVVYG